MTDVVVATSDRDAAAAAAVEQHHAQLASTLQVRVEAVIGAAARHDPRAASQATDELVAWCEGELVPHALAEEKAMYPAAHETAEGRLLVTAMLAEHDVIVGLVRDLAEAADIVRAAAAAKALLVTFQGHLAKENQLMLPLLARTTHVSVADLLEGMHELLGAAAQRSAQDSAGCGGHECACGETDGAQPPELDVRQVPHAIRHATVFGALEAIRPGGALVLVAPHDPLPLLAQIGERFGGAFEVEYLEQGPQAWRIALVRAAVA